MRTTFDAASKDKSEVQRRWLTPHLLRPALPLKVGRNHGWQSNVAKATGAQALDPVIVRQSHASGRMHLDHAILMISRRKLQASKAAAV